MTADTGMEGMNDLNESSGPDGDLSFFEDGMSIDKARRVVKPTAKPAAKHSYMEEDSTDEAKPKETAPRKEVLKIDDEDVEVDPSEFEAKTIKEAEQLKRASYKRMQEAAEYKKQVDAKFAEREKEFASKESHAAQTLQRLQENLQNDPSLIFDLAKKLGHDPDTLAEERLYKKWQYANMTDEQRKLQEYEAKVADFEARDKARLEYEQTQAERAQEQALHNAKIEYAGTADNELKQFFAEHGKPDPLHFNEMLKLVHASIAADKPISFLDAHHKVQAFRPSSNGTYFKNMTEDEIDNLPSDFLERVRTRDVARLRAAAAPGRKVSNTPSEQRVQHKQNNVFTADQFFDELDQKNRA